MRIRRLICLLLALVLLALCFAGCRSKKEEPVEEIEEEQPSITVVPPPDQEGIKVNEDELVIEIPEGSELVGD